MMSDTSRSSGVSNITHTIHAPSYTSPPGTANAEGEYRSQTKDHSAILVVSSDQPASVCAKDKVPVPGGSGPSGETVRNEAVRVEDPASQTSPKANDTTPGVSFGNNLSASATGPQVTQRKQLRLEKYDGSSTPLETFLAKYDNCVKYNRWSAEERAVFLRDSLNGNASQVLWESSSDASAEDIIRLLRNRFGSFNQMERYRAELHAKRRMRGESAQVLYQDIKRLLALGFPGQSGELYEIIGRDAFLTALADPALRIRVLDQNPHTLDEALSIVIRMEAYGQSNAVDDENPERKRVRVISPARETDADRRIRKLEERIECQNKEIQRLKQATDCGGNRQRSQPFSGSGAAHGGGGPYGGSNAAPQGGFHCGDSGGGQTAARGGGSTAARHGGPYGGSYGGLDHAPTFPGFGGSCPQAGWPGVGPNYVDVRYAAAPDTAPPWPQQQWAERPAAPGGPSAPRGTGKRQAYNRLPRDVCSRCRQRGHWRAQCPVSGFRPYPSDTGDDYHGGPGQNYGSHPVPDTSNVQVMSGKGRAETYVNVTVRGRKASALLDSGCERSICPFGFCRNAKISPMKAELFAANATPISVVGVTRLPLEIDGMLLQAEVLVSEDIDELILGYNFLENNHCEWLFGQHRILINGRSVPLHSRQSKALVRRIYVREPVIIPPDTSVNVPVRMPFVDLYTPDGDWISESRQIRPGLLAARTLLPHDDVHAAIAFMNVSGINQSLKPGLALGVATPCPPDTVRPLVAAKTGLAEQGDSQNDVPAAKLTDVNYRTSEPPSDNDDTRVKCASVHITDETPHKEADHKGDDCFHVQPVIDKLPSSLTTEQRERAIALIRRNADIFSRSEFDVGCTDLITARIITDGHGPIAEPLRRHARVHLDVIDDTVERMKAAGIVEDACSPWAANLVVVAKRDDQGNPTTPRVTIDFRGLNAITYRDRYPIPHLKDCLQSLDKARFLSIIDLSNSFYQVPIAEEDRDKAAFVTRRGQFRLTRLAQGCTNSPSVFCRLMGLVLKGLTCCLAYIDDTICHSPSFEAHIADLEAVFDRFRQANLKLKATKCKLFQERCRFVGHIVSAHGIEVDPEKVACIVHWPFPRNISELRGFLGLCSYYRSFCKGFASIAEPLTQCLRKGVALYPTSERVAAFDKLKQMLTTAPVLAMPRDDEECMYVVDSDASSYAASAVLQQWQDGRLRVLEYASRTFNKAERGYCATRREMAALIFGLKQFRSYLLGRHFQIRVDNQALTHYQRSKDASGQCARHLDFLADFDFEIAHRNGSNHTNVDSVTRLRPCEVDGGEPCAQCSKRVNGKHRVRSVQTRAQRKKTENRGGDSGEAISESGVMTDSVEAGSNRCRRRRRMTPLQSIAPTAWQAREMGWTSDNLRNMQLRDNDIGPAIKWVECNERPPWPDVQGQSPMLRALWQQVESLVLFDGVLYRSFYDTNGIVSYYQLILPSEIKVPFLEMIHNDAAGHLKYAKCIQHVMRRAWWYDFKRDLKLFLRCCAKCESHHRGKPPKQARLRPMLVGSPGERWCIDLCGPYPVSNGYRYIFTAICPFSKFGVCAPLRNKEAATVAKAIVDHVFLKWGLCSEILTDQGSEFEAELLAELLKILGVTRLRTSGYRPSTNGACEVWHRTLHTMMSKVVDDNQRDWSNWVAYITFCYNATEHSATHFPPFFVFTGRMPLWTVDLTLPDVQDKDRTLPEYTAQVVERLRIASNLVRENLRTAAGIASRWYNRRAKPRVFAPGDPVRIFYPRRYAGRTMKWQNFFKYEGQVLKKLNDATYLVKTKNWKEPKIVHADKLKPLLSFQ